MTNAIDIATAIREELSQSFSIPLGGNGVTDDADLIEAGLLDSYGLIELITFLESHFSITLTNDDMMSSQLNSVAGMAALVMARKA